MSRSSRSSVVESGAALALQGGRLNRLFLIFSVWTTMGAPYVKFGETFATNESAGRFRLLGRRFLRGRLRVSPRVKRIKARSRWVGSAFRSNWRPSLTLGLGVGGGDRAFSYQGERKYLSQDDTCMVHPSRTSESNFSYSILWRNRIRF